ncbi:F0F1 ATP synthase subunit epsilon [Tistrella mobilis]|jgi:F-type H+-transporting ATPase subunit epsilon|uniref:ATP synthase epsilon chain n=2 Tax=Tistrella mobilis TaxID=171437 RepID=I3TPY4_TISMK|nr:F0F1 ATP synthase subunit epsilon [Tistrella mobilis]AFK54822.1 F-type H+-transporting ATPase epsilon chain [Tistrella mobilis KA081020-065]KYO56297.1 ATP synthase subunit epsilon [Tistrella mobilis]MAM75410.1 F0F1 ATP synthase subunit epsilon [Tistrella sp.]
MSDKVRFELVSPERLLLARDVDMVVVPGSEGHFGVLPGHAPLIATMRPGVIEVYEGQTVVDRLFVAGGMVEVTEASCIVLAEDALNLKDVNRGDAEARAKAAREDLSLARDEAERLSAERKIAEAEALLQAVA